MRGAKLNSLFVGLKTSPAKKEALRQWHLHRELPVSCQAVKAATPMPVGGLLAGKLASFWFQPGGGCNTILRNRECSSAPQPVNGNPPPAGLQCIEEICQGDYNPDGGNACFGCRSGTTGPNSYCPYCEEDDNPTNCNCEWYCCFYWY